MEKMWFMAPVEYNQNGKSIVAPKEYFLMVHSPNRKGLVLRKIVKKKIQHKRYNANQN